MAIGSIDLTFFAVRYYPNQVCSRSITMPVNPMHPSSPSFSRPKVRTHSHNAHTNTHKEYSKSQSKPYQPINAISNANEIVAIGKSPKTNPFLLQPVETEMSYDKLARIEKTSREPSPKPKSKPKAYKKRKFTTSTARPSSRKLHSPPMTPNSHPMSTPGSPSSYNPFTLIAESVLPQGSGVKANSFERRVQAGARQRTLSQGSDLSEEYVYE
jgi:hypothetical protein